MVLIIVLVTLLLLAVGFAVGTALANSELKTKLSDARSNYREEHKDRNHLQRKYDKLARDYAALLTGFEKKLEPEVAAAVDDLEDWIEDFNAETQPNP